MSKCSLPCWDHVGESTSGFVRSIQSKTVVLYPRAAQERLLAQSEAWIDDHSSRFARLTSDAEIDEERQRLTAELLLIRLTELDWYFSRRTVWEFGVLKQIPLNAYPAEHHPEVLEQWGKGESLCREMASLGVSRLRQIIDRLKSLLPGSESMSSFPPALSEQTIPVSPSSLSISANELLVFWPDGLPVSCKQWLDMRWAELRTRLSRKYLVRDPWPLSSHTREEAGEELVTTVLLNVDKSIGMGKFHEDSSLSTYILSSLTRGQYRWLKDHYLLPVPKFVPQHLPNPVVLTWILAESPDVVSDYIRNKAVFAAGAMISPLLDAASRPIASRYVLERSSMPGLIRQIARAALDYVPLTNEQEIRDSGGDMGVIVGKKGALQTLQEGLNETLCSDLNALLLAPAFFAEGRFRDVDLPLWLVKRVREVERRLENDAVIRPDYSVQCTIRNVLELYYTEDLLLPMIRGPFSSPRSVSTSPMPPHDIESGQTPMTENYISLLDSIAEVGIMTISGSNKNQKSVRELLRWYWFFLRSHSTKPENSSITEQAALGGLTEDEARKAIQKLRNLMKRLEAKPLE